VKRSAILFVALSLAVRCSSVLAQTAPVPSASSDSGIEGTILISPAHGGPTRVGVPDSKPLTNVQFVVINEKGMAGSFTTDGQGKFKVSLAPGHYQVAKREKSAIGRCGPFEIDVIAGQMTRVEWRCDSGMR
jgi:hypothetical protein